MRQVALVIETTGVDESARIIEIAAVEMQNGKPTGNAFNVAINPHHKVTAEAESLIHLKNLNVKKFPDFASVADNFLAFIKDADVVIHFIPFIKPILDKELEKAGKPSFKDSCHHIVDTWHLDKKLSPATPHSLDAIALRHGLIKEKRTDRQGARDARLLADVYGCLIKDAAKNNVKVGPEKKPELIIERFFPAAKPDKPRYNLRTRPALAEHRFKPY